VKPGLKLALQYIISLALAIVLIYFALKDQNLSEIGKTLKDANPLYIIISTVFLSISHIVRALRWKILYRPLGYHPSTKNAFLALMSGYFMNQLIPRLGEVTRCGVLQKNEKIPLPISFGTVITERLMDLVMLILLFIFTFYIEFDRLNSFFMQFLNDKFGKVDLNSPFIYLFAGIILFGAFTLYFVYQRFKEKIHNHKLFSKIWGFVENIIKGVISIRNVKEWEAFTFYSIIIWAMYYGASTIVFLSLPSTSDLSFVAGFSILLMGSLAMTAPVQGGIGAYHIFVSAVLMLYGVSKKDSSSFAILVHGSQYLFTLISGGICFLISFYVKKRESLVSAELLSEAEE
jgi:glycosyltransferase 2 family protein